MADERMDMLAACRERGAALERAFDAEHGNHIAERQDAARALDAERADRIAEELAHAAARGRLAACEGLGDRLIQELHSERERYSALVAQMIELKKQDYGPAPVIPMPPQQPITPIPAEIMANIARTTDPETRERRMVERRVRDLLAAKVPAEEVSKMVLVGEEIADDLL